MVDYPTPDGTGVRDYIHVVDLVVGHLCALDKLEGESGISIWSLGTRNGVSALEFINAFEKCIVKAVPYKIAPRRGGDVVECWADPRKAKKICNDKLLEKLRK